MAKSKVTQKDTQRQETINPYFPNDNKIIKKLNGSGKASYHHPTGGKVCTWTNDLYSQLTLSFSRFKAMVAMLDDDDYDRFGFVFKSLIRDAENQLDEMFERVHDVIGVIELEIVSVDNRGYRDGMIVDANIEPITKASPETAT